ncbi:hypothetical protein [Ruminococcus sp.]|uniref:hypothetical protein n=1 Tax=Ruminococcus sp. TaxID=41978 RepID=UPI003F0D60B8
MNTKYKTSTNFSKDNYNKLSPSAIFSLYKSLKSDIPFSPCQCTFIYKIDNAICTCDVNNIPKNMSLPSAEYLVLDFVSDNDDSVSVTFTPDSISVSAYLPYDYQNTKAFVNNMIETTVFLFAENSNSAQSTKNCKNNDVNQTNNKQWYRSTLFWTIFGAVTAVIIGIISIVLQIIKP